MEMKLGSLISGESKILSGRDTGEVARKRFKLDELDIKDEKVVVNIPKRVWSINSSFFLGCFGKSVRTLGEEKFREKYIFDCDEVLRANVDDGISRAINNSSPI